jgi:hypothetical protein
LRMRDHFTGNAGLDPGGIGGSPLLSARDGTAIQSPAAGIGSCTVPLGCRFRAAPRRSTCPGSRRPQAAGRRVVSGLVSGQPTIGTRQSPIANRVGCQPRADPISNLRSRIWNRACRVSPKSGDTARDYRTVKEVERVGPAGFSIVSPFLPQPEARAAGTRKTE